MSTEQRRLACELVDFIDASPTAFHAVKSIADMLDSYGFTRLSESGAWELCAGEDYYVTRNGSSVIAFRIPEEDMTGFNITASHSDSPCFKLKAECEMKDGDYVRINTERYGGMIYSSWLDRPLGVAGRLVLSGKDGIESRLVCVDRDMFIIPSVAIHMKRDINDGMKYNPAVDTVPLYSCLDTHTPLIDVVAKSAGVEPENITAHDLYVYLRQKGSVWGEGGEFVSSRSLDDLQCAFATLKGFLSADVSSAVGVYACFDNEEVGSATKQGAASTFLYDTLSRIAESRGKALRDLLSSSFMLSCDNAHAVHPNHPEYSDKYNKVKLNGGVVIKHNASQKYTTDAVSASVVKLICDRNHIPYQEYANRSDIAGGSTLGGIATTCVSVNSADIGIAQLSMHSCYETAGAHDTAHLAELSRAFFETPIKCERDGKYLL